MLSATFIKYPLKFLRPAGTSRGTLLVKNSWFIQLVDTENPELRGIGECSVIPGLSPDDRADFEPVLKELCNRINTTGLTGKVVPKKYPAIKFGLETALLDLEGGGKRILFPSEFTAGKKGIAINGLIWMGNMQDMLQQIDQKMDLGYRVLKMKVGALSFEDELTILQHVREGYDPASLEIRLDANGAWSPEEALSNIEKLSKYHIHSIEQPIQSGRVEEMAGLCRKSPVPVALDEELIGVYGFSERKVLLDMIRPAYIILKPGLLGGFQASMEWIELARQLKTGWWVTSALESNIGLNAIAQWAASLNPDLPQGLGTGQLYQNNIPSPLYLQGDSLWYDKDGRWDFSALGFK
ncbi:MAG: o-succinylbenzoate synthase [Bacteroidales bacterium]|nr:o-succinylbenzoate synthase [Bacteroidales bacterium]